MRSNTLNNRYRLDKKIGEGGFAHVFLATDLLLSRQVAVKVMEESQIKDKELLARFHKEAQAIAATRNYAEIDHSPSDPQCCVKWRRKPT